MNHEKSPQINIETWLEIGETEFGIIESLKLISPEENSEFLNYLDASEVELDKIKIPKDGKRARELFNIKLAAMYALAGFVEHAEGLLSDIEQIALETENSSLEDAVVNTQNELTSLGVLKTTTPPSPTSPLQ